MPEMRQCFLTNRKEELEVISRVLCNEKLHYFIETDSSEDELMYILYIQRKISNRRYEDIKKSINVMNHLIENVRQ